MEPPPIMAPTALAPLSARTRGHRSLANKHGVGFIQSFILIKSVTDVLIGASQPKSEGRRPASGCVLTGARS